MDLRTEEKIEDVKMDVDAPPTDVFENAESHAETASTAQHVAPALTVIMRPVEVLPRRPSNATDEDSTALYNEFKEEDWSSLLTQAETKSLLSLPPAGLARKVRELQNKMYSLQSEEADLALELGLPPLALQRAAGQR